MNDYTADVSINGRTYEVPLENLSSDYSDDEFDGVEDDYSDPDMVNSVALPKKDVTYTVSMQQECEQVYNALKYNTPFPFKIDTFNPKFTSMTLSDIAKYETNGRVLQYLDDVIGGTIVGDTNVYTHNERITDAVKDAYLGWLAYDRYKNAMLGKGKGVSADMSYDDIADYIRRRHNTL